MVLHKFSAAYNISVSYTHLAALLERCDERVVLHARYETGCMFERNRYMVDRCDMVLAYLRGACEKGGTYYTCLLYTSRCV